MTPSRPISTLALALRAGVLLAASSICLAAAAAGSDPHVASAERLVDQLNLANTGYAHGPGSVTWTGTVASHTDCSGFIDQLLVHKYLTRHDNTGHIMLVIEAPRHMNDSPPCVDRATQWSVTVIDSSESGHGPTDTRHKRGEGGHDHDGLGRGVFRLYANGRGEVVGFSWSTTKASRFVAPEDEHLVLGRLSPGFRP